MTTKPQPASFLRDQREPKKIVRYRAHYGPLTVSQEETHHKTDLFRTSKAALDRIVYDMVGQGILRIEEVPVKRKQHTEWVEEASDA